MVTSNPTGGAVSSNSGTEDAKNSTPGSINANGTVLSFGDFGTQDCGAWSMLLLHAQGKMAQVGSQIAQEFTTQQKEEFVQQSQFLQNGLDRANEAAHAQKQQMFLEAASNFTQAAVSIGGMVGASKLSEFTEANKQLDHANDKLTQQENLREVALKTTPKPTSANIQPGQPSTEPDPTSAREEYIRNRRAELLRDGGGQARELTGQPSTKFHGANKEEEEFPQDGYDKKAEKYEFNRSKGHYYRRRSDTPKENQELFDKEVNSKCAANGAYHLKTLDEEAIKAMNTDQHAAFLRKLDEQIGQTKTEINSAQQRLTRFTQTSEQVLGALQKGIQGGFQVPQANETADAKKHDAQSTINNQEAGVASGIVQAAAGARASILDSVEKAMQGFGGTFQAMRG